MSPQGVLASEATGGGNGAGAVCAVHGLCAAQLVDHEGRIREGEKHDAEQDKDSEARKREAKAEKRELLTKVFGLALLGGFTGSAAGNLIAAWLGFLKGIVP
jgi:hypothetical protein